MMVTMERIEFRRLRRAAGISTARLCELCEASPRTLRRWDRQGRYPQAAVALLQALSGDLEPHGWRGWRLHAGRLWAPGARRGYEREELERLPMERWHLEALQQQVRSLKAGRAAPRSDPRRARPARPRAGRRRRGAHPLN